MEFFGHPSPGLAPAANCTRVQIVLKCPCSMNSECGSVTWILLMFASLPRGFSTARNFGLSPLLVPPNRWRLSLGLNPSDAQSAAWNGLVTVTGSLSPGAAKSRPEPSTVLAVEVRLQLVGLNTNSGLST